MTRSEAIAKAQIRAAHYGQPYLVTSRTAHPAYPGQTVHLTLPVADKHAWAPDEQLVFHSDHPDDLAGAWYALDCPPVPSREPASENRQAA